MSGTHAAVHAETTRLRGIRGTQVWLLLFAVVSILIVAFGGRSAKNALVRQPEPTLRLRPRAGRTRRHSLRPSWR
ncbi:hypothetical protein [Streptomyces canus]|uniref:hypothetical protein n=1 Tax=Streptomyces canus TaxID=58343 RepID=UPI00277E80B3|nr:hypothetical protein [Streptomyces canus]MDQ1067164.1 hypothetical protein [Streptomyces canus]